MFAQAQLIRHQAKYRLKNNGEQRNREKTIPVSVLVKWLTSASHTGKNGK
jgi:hypothetical protein